jgi:thioredoxin-dependent peroxiredoxin
MATVTLKGNPFHTIGDLPATGTRARPFRLTRTDFRDVRLEDFAGKRKILNIFLSVDTSVCALSVRTFNARAAALPGVVVLNISADLPYAQRRFCGAEGIEGVETLSTFRSTFASDWGLAVVDGPLEGLCSRAVIVLDEQDRVVYIEQVPEISQEPDYDRALAALWA